MTTTELTRLDELEALARLIRHQCLVMTTEAGSGHPTSALSAADLMTALLFSGAFRYDADRPDHPNNDRLIFSKGHASPLLYALWFAAGKLTDEELKTYREFESRLEGHPTPALPFVEAATGSLGQGLSIGVGMALNARYLDELPYRTFVLLGDSEMAEGSQWEAMQIAAHYKLNNLVGIIDVNGLGQRGPTMFRRDLAAYERRVASFDWKTITIDGHSMQEIVDALGRRDEEEERPTMIIAGTVKGKGVKSLENQDDWHGKALSKDELPPALEDLGAIDSGLRGTITLPEDRQPRRLQARKVERARYEQGDKVATRKAYGEALKRAQAQFPAIVALDGEVSNSTKAETFRDSNPELFFEMFIAEQNMVGAALGLARRGKIPFVSTFAAFFTRAFDQIRMSQYSCANIKFVGSHAGVAIGEDGPSQMGLEDIAMFRTIHGGTVLHPCDAVSTDQLVQEAARQQGIVYIRTLRQGTPVIYSADDAFPIGGSKTLRRSQDDVATIVAAGATVHEALDAHAELQQEGIAVRVIDLYSIKPPDEATLLEAAAQTKLVVTVEDHYPEGGLGEAVGSALAPTAVPRVALAVRRRPMSGTSAELLDYANISARAIVEQVKQSVCDLRPHAGGTSI